MSKMSELDDAIKELRRCGETLIGISETLRELFSTQDAAPEAPVNLDDFETIYDPAEDEPKPEPVTFVQLRSRLSEISRAGHTQEVKELIAKYNAEKLSDIAEADYAAVLAEAKGLV